MNLSYRLLTSLLFLSINNFLIGQSHFIYTPNLFNTADYHSMSTKNKTHEKTGILDFRTFSSDSLLNGTIFGLYIKGCIF